MIITVTVASDKESHSPRTAASASVGGTDVDAETKYTIDEISALTRIPSRTIRYYQSEGALPKPTIQGRVAYYGKAHAERLAQIAALQDRGLQIKAIRDVLQQAEKGDFSLQDWFGSHDRIVASWAPGNPRVMTDAELHAELTGRRSGLLGELLRMNAVERRGDAYLIPIPALFSLALRLDAAGLPLDVIEGAFKLLRKRLGKLAEELTAYFVKNADALGEGGNEAFDELRPASMEAVRVVFAHEMERSIRKANESGAVTAFTRKKRTSKPR